MIEFDSALDRPFSDRIDCRFPYGDLEAASALIREARSISLNACFRVLEEICRPPQSALVTKARQHDLLEEWSYAFEHPLKEALTRCAVSLIEGVAMPWRQCADIMRLVEPYRAQFAALDVVHFAAEIEDPNGDDALEELGDKIRAAWVEVDNPS